MSEKSAAADALKIALRGEKHIDLLVHLPVLKKAGIDNKLTLFSRP